MADRGAVRFDYPHDWFIPDEDSVKLFDKEPPDDDSRLASYVRLPPVDWSGLRMAALLDAGMRADERPIGTCGPMIEVQRGDLELAWREVRFLDLGDVLGELRICRLAADRCSGLDWVARFELVRPSTHS